MNLHAGIRHRLRFRVLPAALVGAGLLLAGKLGMLVIDYRASGEAPIDDLKIAALASIVPAAGKAEEGAAAKATPAASDKAEKEKSATKPEKRAAAAGEAKAGADSGKAAKAEAEGGTAADGTQAAVTGEPTAAEGDAGGDHKGVGARLGLDDENFDPMMLTRAEIELLQGLSKRREALEAREREFALKEQTLAAAEQKLDAKITALEDLKKTVEGLLGQTDKLEEERLGSLVKIYESMKPNEAAPILDGLEQDTLLDVIERMKASKSASILALLDPARAKTITEAMIARRRVPKPEGKS